VGAYMSLSNPTLALYAKTDGIHLRITAKAASRKQAESLIEEREARLREILKDNVWGADDDTLEAIISRLLIEKGLSLAVAESYTGGFLAYTLSSLPESQRFFKGGIITLDSKIRADLNILPETPSLKADTHSAAGMAALARKEFSADIGIGIDCSVDTKSDPPSGDAFIGINLKQKEHNIVQEFHWRPSQIIRRSVMHTLFTLRKILLAI
jgi:nicotinamide-nucleotide amidase